MEFDEEGKQILHADEIFDVIESALRAQENSGRTITVMNLLGAIAAIELKAKAIQQNVLTVG